MAREMKNGDKDLRVYAREDRESSTTQVALIGCDRDIILNFTRIALLTYILNPLSLPGSGNLVRDGRWTLPPREPRNGQFFLSLFFFFASFHGDYVKQHAIAANSLNQLSPWSENQVGRNGGRTR